MPEKQTENKTPLNVYQRMHQAAQAIQGRIAKAQENKFQHYKYASHDDVVEFCRPSLLDAGLLIICDMPKIETRIEEIGEKKTATMIAEGVLAVTILNVDNPDDRYTINVPGMGYDTSDKAVGKLISYAKKYALTAMCGLLVATGDDADKDSIQGPTKKGRHEIKRETDTARTVIFKDITKARETLGWTKDDVAAAAAKIGITDPINADPADLQKLLETMRAEIRTIQEETKDNA